jgi:hypothetical protein
VDLGRVIAADRNALAAIEAAKAARSAIHVMESKVDSLQRQVIQQGEQIHALQIRLASMRGTGPSER